MEKRSDTGKVVRVLMQRYGTPFSEELGIDLKSPGPSALFRWLCATILFSTRISARTAMKAAKALVREGWTTPQKMAATSWEERVHTLNASGYARYDESTSTKLGDAVELLMNKYGGDLRQLRESAHHDPASERELLMEFRGIGDVGADIFFREIQIAWNELRPFADKRALQVARRLHIGRNASDLAKLVKASDLPRLLAALVRCGLAKDEDVVLEAAAA